MAPKPQREDYTVGWVCALPIEFAAAQLLLDTQYAPFPQGPNEPTFPYKLGCIGSHNVVIACLPAGRPGTNSALSVALQMRSMFTSIQYGLMVGIGGGVPKPKNNLRLGDVVFSQPDGAHGGVVQYEFGKDIPGGLRRTGHLSAPPEHLLNALQTLKARHSMTNFGFLDHLSKLTRPGSPFLRPNDASDVLFAASYEHKDSDDAVGCYECAQESLVNRDKWQARTGPVQVHFGTIASDNRLMRDGNQRDRISKELGGVLCFEMEAAGLMNHFPCLVIRGIADYSDSHKSDDWQKYAAATAASCAKEILLLIPAVANLPRYRTHFSLEGVPVVKEFVQRPAEMVQLEKALLPQPDTQRRKILALCGLGGIGKTQLAVEFVRRRREKFSSVFWLAGDTAHSLRQSIARCATRIPKGQISEDSRQYALSASGNVEAVVSEVLGWLAQPDNTSWLLVFDNVDREFPSLDAHAYDIRKYFPDADHGSVLITTRLMRLQQLGESQQLGRVDRAQAQAILGSWYKHGYDAVEGERLFEMLDGLPLAIAQAGAYLQESGVELQKYLEFYKHQWKELMETHDQSTQPLQDYADRSVWTTWTISYNAIRTQDEATANLLLLWSLLDNKDLWYELFVEACSASGQVARELSAWC